MSAKKHVILPEYFQESHVVNRTALAPFPHVTNQECARLRQQRYIEPIGKSGRLWRLLMKCKTTASFETGDGLVSKAIPWSIQQVIQSEITGHHIYETEDLKLLSKFDRAYAGPLVMQLET